MSPADFASLLFANFFLPPKPNFSSFFCRFLFGPAPDALREARSFLSVSAASSSATSKRSSSLAVRASLPD